MSGRSVRDVGTTRARVARSLAVALALGALSCDGSSLETPEEPCALCDLQQDAGPPDDASAIVDVSSTTDASSDAPEPSAPAGGSAGSSRCGTAEASVTEAVQRAYGFAELRALLVDQQHVFHMQQRVSNTYNAPFIEQVTEVELKFELGEFSFHESSSMEQDYCDHVAAPLRIEARDKDGMVGFTAKGSLWRQEASLETLVQATVDPASVTGTLFSARLAELSLSLFPGHVRGEIHSAGLVLSLTPDACSQHELPLQPDEHVDFLGGRSVAELVTEAEGKLRSLGVHDAVWQDGANTTVRIELGRGAESASCAQYGLAVLTREGARLQPHVELHVPYAGRLSTGDGRIALPLGELLLAVGSADGALWSINGRGNALAADFGSAADSARGFDDRLDAHIEFDVASQPASADGIVRVGHMMGPYSWTTIDCVAWPTGGYWDRNDCRYQR